MNLEKDFYKMNKRRILIAKKWFNRITYPFLAAMDRRKFWMVNAAFPYSPDGKSLSQAVIDANSRGTDIVDLGCGRYAQSLIDLEIDGYNNLKGVDIRLPKNKNGIELVNSNLTKLPFENSLIQGVIYSTYVLQHLTPEEQYAALTEIGRVSGKGCRGYLGPINPQMVNKSSFWKEKYPNAKNLYLAFVNEMNKSGNGKWILKKSLLTNTSFFVKNNKFKEFIYRGLFPFLMFFLLAGRALSQKISPKFIVKRDFYEKTPYEYFITFVK